MNLPGDCI